MSDCNLACQPPFINQGDSKVVKFQLRDCANPNQFFDLTGASEIKVVFPATNLAGFIEKTLTGSSVTIIQAAAGLLSASLSSADTLLLPPGQRISIEVKVTISGVISSAQFINAIQVNEELFPGS